MESTRWWTYLSEVMGDDTATKAAKKTGISASNFTRWKQGANADPEFVVKVARAYKVNVRRALVEANFITEEEAGFIKEQPGQTEAHLYESLQKLKNIIEESEGVVKSMYEERRRQTPHLTPVSDPSGSLHDDDDGVVREFDYSPDEYAADSSPNEQEEREKRGEDPID